MIHVDDLGLTTSETLKDVSEILRRDIDVDRLDWLQKFSTFTPLVDDLGTGDEKLEALTAHLLHNDGDLHLSARLDLEVTGKLRLLHLDRDIGTGLAGQTLLDLACGDKLALLTDERSVVDADLHRDGWGIDIDESERLTCFVIGDGLPYVDLFEAAETDDVTGAGFLKLDLLKSLVAEDRRHGLLFFCAVLVDSNDLLTHLDRAADDAAEGDTTEVVAVIEVGNKHLEVVDIRLLRSGDMLDDGLVERLHRGALLVDLVLGKPLFGAGVDHGEVELRVVGTEFEEELENHVENLMRVGVVAVDLVDDNDRLEAVLQSLLEHELGLGLGTTKGIHDKKHSVHHLHDALHLAAEVGVARGVDDIDMVFMPLEGGVLSLDGDALLTLQIHGIHDADLGGFGLVGSESPRLLQKLIDESCLPVIDVGDDGDVANIIHGLFK